MQSPTVHHFQALKHILWYVKGMLHYVLYFSTSSPTSFIVYSDADWAGCLDARRSTSSYVIFLGDNLISWTAKKQHSISHSSCESEYRALAHTTSEVVWITHLLRDQKFPYLTSYYSFVITRVRFFLLSIQFLTKDQNTLLLITTLFVN